MNNYFRQFVYLLTFIVTNTILAQDINYEIKKGEISEEEYKYNYCPLDLVEDGNEGFILLRGYLDSGMFYYVEHYDKDLKLLNRFDHKTKVNKNNYPNHALGLIKSENQISLIDFGFYKEEKAFICKAWQANINEFKLEPIELFRIDEKLIKHSGYHPDYDIDKDWRGIMVTNKDKTHFGISIKLKNSELDTRHVYLFDNKLNKVLDKEIIKEIKDKNFHYQDLTVSNDGNSLNFLGKIYGKLNENDKNKIHFELTNVTPSSDKNIIFNLNDNFSPELKLITLEDKVNCIGYFTDESNLDPRLKGVVHISFDNSLNNKSVKFNKFTEAFLQGKTNDLSSNNQGIKNIKPRQVIITSQGDIIFNGEINYSVPYGSFSTNVYSDIIVTKLDKAGELLWFSNIEKGQRETFTHSTESFSSFFKDNSMYYLINNTNKKKGDKIIFGDTTEKEANLTLLKLDENGKLTYTEILNGEKDEMFFDVSKGKRVYDSFILNGNNKRKKQIIKVKI